LIGNDEDGEHDAKIVSLTNDSFGSVRAKKAVADNYNIFHFCVHFDNFYDLAVEFILHETTLIEG